MGIAPILGHQLFVVAALRDAVAGEFAEMFEDRSFACWKVNLAASAAISAARNPGVGAVMLACSFHHREKLLTERWTSGDASGD